MKTPRTCINELTTQQLIRELSDFRDWLELDAEVPFEHRCIILNKYDQTIGKLIT